MQLKFIFYIITTEIKNTTQTTNNTQYAAENNIRKITCSQKYTMPIYK